MTQNIIIAEEGKVYVTNAFSLNMLPLEKAQYLGTEEILEIKGYKPLCFKIELSRVGLEFIKSKLTFAKEHGRLISVIGHEGTAKLVSELIGVEIPVNRALLKIENIGEYEFIIIQVLERLPEGKVLSKEEIEEMLKKEKIQFLWVWITYYGKRDDETIF